MKERRNFFRDRHRPTRILCRPPYNAEEFGSHLTSSHALSALTCLFAGAKMIQFLHLHPPFDGSAYGTGARPALRSPERLKVHRAAQSVLKPPQDLLPFGISLTQPSLIPTWRGLCSSPRRQLAGCTRLRMLNSTVLSHATLGDLDHAFTIRRIEDAVWWL